jgi:ribose-phosphate pyrophosphokinase
MIDTGGTTVAAIETLYENGAKEVYVAATHGVFSTPAKQLIRDSAVKEVVVTDTIKIKLEPEDTKIKVLSVAGILAKVLRAVFDDESVSDIFAGEHQLF